jgi:hypothetical protein
MTKDEWSKLATSLQESLNNRQSGAAEQPIQRLAAGTTGSEVSTSLGDVQTLVRLATASAASAVSAKPSTPDFDVERIAAGFASAEAEARLRQDESSRPPKQSQSQASQSEGSIAGTVLKTAGMVTGVGPIVTGLLKLFGGSDEKPAVPTPLLPYSAPQSVAVEAGLTADRRILGVGYSQNGQARAASSQPPQSSSAPIQITVQAMDSRSFMDHSDDIARAVRNAMLRSHSINDVVAEL